MTIGIIVKYCPATNTIGSRQRATVIMPSGRKSRFYNGCYDIPVGGDARYEAASKLADKEDLRLTSDEAIYIDANTVVYPAVGRTD